MKMKHIKTRNQLNESSENLNTLEGSDVMKRINELKDEYERIRNYEYDEYDDEFDAMNRKRDIQMIFYTLGIDFDRFDR